MLLGIALALLPQPGRAELLDDFIVHCRQEALGDCFYRIGERLNRLNAGAAPRICLPRTFGGLVLERGVIPVSVLEHFRLRLSAARFGQASADVDEVMVRIANGMYPCDQARHWP
jgi:hypothetical protein